MSSTELPTAPDERPDALVLGAGLAGVTTALMLARRHPGARVLVVERSAAPPERGLSEPLRGAAGVVFQQVLGVADLLAREHLPRHGEHFWFAASHRARLAELSEVGADELGSAPAHHVDTALLARGLARLAEAEGVRFLYDTEAVQAHVGWPASRLEVETPGGPRTLRARWLVDAGGAEARLAHDLGLVRPLGAPAALRAAANWTEVAPIDAPGAGSDAPAPFPRSRALATHLFVGPRWRVRLAPHVGGGSSVELFVDHALWNEVAGGRAPLEAYSRFVRDCPGLRELLRAASVDPQSFQARRHEDRTVLRRGGRGWFLVGDAALAPLALFGSPLEALARTAWNAAELIADDLSGAAGEHEVAERLRRYELRERQQDAAAVDALRARSLELAGDAALLTVAYGLHRSVQAQEIARLASDPRRLAVVSWHTLWQRALRGGVYGRLRRLARSRWESGLYGARNARRQVRLGPGEGMLRPLLAAAGQWVEVEYAGLREALRPVEHDAHAPDGPTIERRAAALLAELSHAADGARPAAAPDAPAGEERDPFAAIE